MKRTTTIVLVLIFACMSIFAATNDQTIYSVDDSIYKQIETLYIAEGYGAPSSSGPWSGNELLHMMDKIVRGDLPTALQTTYDEVMEKLDPKATLDFGSVAFGFNFDLNTEVYYRQQGIQNGEAVMKSLMDFGGNLADLQTYLESEEVTQGLTVAIGGGKQDAIPQALAAVSAYNEAVTKKDPYVVAFLETYGKELDDATIDLPPDPTKKEDLYEYFANGGLENQMHALNDAFINEEAIKAYIERYYYTTEEEASWFHGYQYREPFFKINFETWATDHFYGYFGLGLGDTDMSYLYALRLNSNMTPLLGLPKTGVVDLDKGLGKRMGSSNIFGEPMKAIASVGGDKWNLVAGRDKLSWGVGETGNLMLSDSFPQHTFAKFTTYHNVFKYSLLGTIYPYYNEYYTIDCGRGYGQGDAIDGYKSMIAHRLECSFWKNRINFAVTEACMFRKTNGDDRGFTMALINPFGFMHNEYNRINGNSLLVFEADGTPVKGVNVYAQFALDDFALPGESDTIVPAATGFLAGVRGVYPVLNGVLKYDAEYVKTDPYLYLRGAYEDTTNSYGTGDPSSYGYGYDALYRHFSVAAGVLAENKFTTYKYGNDVKILQAKVAYEMPGLFEAGLGIFRKTAGVMDITSPWGVYSDETNDNHPEYLDYSKLPKVTTPALVDPFAEDYDTVTAEGYTVPEDRAAEVETVITISGTYHTPIENLDVYSYIDILSYNNYNNVKGAKYNDVQATFGVKYSF